jgi:murein DD-endopeptidase MepM/ murein hydrolase activator NlpD
MHTGATIAHVDCAVRRPSGQCVAEPQCPEAQVLLDGICVALRSVVPDDVSGALVSNAHTDRGGNLVVYEHIPRRPDLSADYDRYEYPTQPWGGHTVTSGYDLGRSDASQRRGPDFTAVGHGGVDLPQDRGAPVRVLALRAQQGDAEVVYAGHLFGTTVVLSHVIREQNTTRTYLSLHGHLDNIAPGIHKGQIVTAGTVLGFVGDTGAEGIVHLHYEIRLVRAGINPARVDRPTDLVAQNVSVPCDPRNVLPLRSGPIR